MIATRALRLGVNIDHVATVRNARGGVAPDPVRAALLAVEAGCDGITAHLREDRRHIHDDDIARLKRALTVPLNLEMAATPEMLAIALETRPHAACLVPERRQEQTTEGGLDVVGGLEQLKPLVTELARANIRASLFIEPSIEVVEASTAVGAPVVELHTGRWCEAVEAGRGDDAAREFGRIRAAAERAGALGIECHAGHGLTFETARLIAGLPLVAELNIGHFLIGEAMFAGLVEVVSTMRAAMREGRAQMDAMA